MKLLEMETLPKRAGRAVLRFSPRVRWPHRNKEAILIPKNSVVEFFPLLDGEQFLLRGERDVTRHCRNCGHATRYDDRAVYFGGTDQSPSRSPFLVQLVAEAFKHYRTSGEDRFFQALKPYLIVELERKWGPEHTQRQGDIWAYKLPWSWEDLMRKELADGRDFGVERSPMRRRRGGWRGVLDTRHILKGWQAEVEFTTILGESPPSRGCLETVVEGRIEAPDHKPFILKGPHAVAQTRLLRHPETAD